MGPDEAPAFDHLPIHNRHSWQRFKKKQNDQPEMSKQEKKKSWKWFGFLSLFLFDNSGCKF